MSESVGSVTHSALISTVIIYCFPRVEFSPSLFRYSTARNNPAPSTAPQECHMPLIMSSIILAKGEGWCNVQMKKY